MRKKLFAVTLAAGLAAGLTVPAAAAERDGITLSGDSTYDTVQKITDEDITLKVMLAIRARIPSRILPRSVRFRIWKH